MFTGIIKAIGVVVSAEPVGGDMRLMLDISGTALDVPAAGDSMAVNGVCLTATAVAADQFAADVSRETLARTSLHGLAAGARVNLEPALAAGQPLGGHLVSGHADGQGELMEKTAEARSWRLVFAVPDHLARFVAVKGSVCVDGISLTINEVAGNRFGVNIVPHTMIHTNLGEREIGDRVNLEVDMVARYLDRLLEARDRSP